MFFYSLTIPVESPNEVIKSFLDGTFKIPPFLFA